MYGETVWWSASKSLCVFIAKPFTDYTDEDYDEVAGVNLRGFFDISRSAIAAMLARGSGGHLVNVSTSLVDHANSRVPAALASLTKGGLTAATKSLAIEYAARGIRVNAVALGIIRTPMHPDDTHETLAGMHPLGRMGRIDDVVDAIVYLEGPVHHRGNLACRRRPKRRPLITRDEDLMAITTDNETILRSVLDEWKAAVDAHDPEHAAAIFTNDAIFQGLHPYTVGPHGVAEYYASQPLGMTATYRILETRCPADNLILGYLSVLIQPTPDRAKISH